MAGEDETEFDVSLADASDVTNENAVVKAHKAAESSAGNSQIALLGSENLGIVGAAMRNDAISSPRKSSARPVDAAVRQALQASTYEDPPEEVVDDDYDVTTVEHQAQRPFEAGMKCEREEREREEKEQPKREEEG